MHIAKGLSISEGECYACVPHLDKNASEQEEGEESSLIVDVVSSTPVKTLCTHLSVDRINILVAGKVIRVQIGDILDGEHVAVADAIVLL